MEEKWEDIEKNAIEEENAHKIGIICMILTIILFTAILITSFIIQETNEDKFEITKTEYNKVYGIWIDTSVEECLKHNELRKNNHDHSYVPRKVIRRMAIQFVEPKLDEGFARIYRIKNNEITYKGESFNE